MQTEDLIAQLSASVPRVPRHAAVRRLCAGLACGALVALVALVISLGVRPDLVAASRTFPFWMKWGFTLSLAATAFVILRRLASPEGRAGRAWGWLAIPLAIVALMGVMELATAPADLRLGLWLGHTAWQCAAAIAALSVPLLVGLIWAFRRLAPTRLAETGAAAGLLAGAAGASVYALACPEHTAAFMMSWYTAGILLVGLAGAALGPRLLKW